MLTLWSQTSQIKSDISVDLLYSPYIRIHCNCISVFHVSLECVFSADLLYSPYSRIHCNCISVFHVSLECVFSVDLLYSPFTRIHCNCILVFHVSFECDILSRPFVFAIYSHSLQLYLSFSGFT